MFNPQLILSKKGPLAKIWLAAFHDKKLSKAAIFETNLTATVDKMLVSDMTLRLSGHLLIGTVKINKRKAVYLLEDCREANTKIKVAFRSAAVDLPFVTSEAAAKASTLQLPERFLNFDTEMLEENEDFHLELVRCLFPQSANVRLLHTVDSA